MAKRTTIRPIPALQEELSQLAQEMGVSYNQLVIYALTRFVEAQKGLAILEERVRRGSRPVFLRALKKADRKKLEPAEDDVLPKGYQRRALLAQLQSHTSG